MGRIGLSRSHHGRWVHVCVDHKGENAAGRGSQTRLTEPPHREFNGGNVL